MTNNVQGVKTASKLELFAKNNQIGMALAISVLIFLLTIILNPKSLNINAFGSIFALTAMLTLASAGQTLVIISDGIDMSLGAVMSMTGVLTAGIMRGEDKNVVLCVALSLVIGLFIGFVNGIGAVKINLPPLIVTLCVSNVVTRLQYVITGGKPTGTAGPLFNRTMTYRFFGFIPSSLFYTAAVFALVFYLLHRTRYGQQLYLTGNNKRAAYLTGVITTRIKIMNYAISGMLAGLAGFLGAGYLSYVTCSSMDAYTMKSIVAVVVGGTLLVGGKGSYKGTVAGALLLIVLSNGLTVLNLSQSVTEMIMGVVLILILAAYNRSKPIRQ